MWSWQSDLTAIYLFSLFVKFLANTASLPPTVVVRMNNFRKLAQCLARWVQSVNVTHYFYYSGNILTFRTQLSEIFFVSGKLMHIFVEWLVSGCSWCCGYRDMKEPLGKIYSKSSRNFLNRFCSFKQNDIHRNHFYRRLIDINKSSVPTANCYNETTCCVSVWCKKVWQIQHKSHF